MSDEIQAEDLEHNPIVLREKIFDEHEFMKFISEQVDKFKSHSDIIKNPETISFHDLNRALSEYSTVKSVLLSLQAMAHIECRKRKEEFENWYSHKFVYVRSRENRVDLAAQKWLGMKEIERIIRVEFSFEYKGFKDIMDFAELKEQFLNRMVEAWASHQFILGQLSKNVQTEAMLNGSGLHKSFGED
jgi:hypothetical protein